MELKLLMQSLKPHTFKTFHVIILSIMLKVNSCLHFVHIYDFHYPENDTKSSRIKTIEILWIVLWWNVILLCSVILLPLAITFYVTWGFVHFVDGFFSPVYDHLGINIFGKQNQPFLGSSFSFYSFVGWVLQLTRPCNYNYYETGYTAEKYSSSIAIFYLNHQKAWLNF